MIFKPALLALLLSAPAFAGKTVPVKSHVTKSGTYVAPSVRTEPNKTKADNWSSSPNVNPYTGKQGTKSVDPYAPKPPRKR